MATITAQNGRMKGGFALSMLKNVEKIRKAVNDKCYEISRELFTSIVNLTPSPSNPGDTAKGLLVNNWFPLQGLQFSGETTTDTSPDGSASKTRINALRGLEFYGKDGVVTLSNNLSYAYRAEVLGWPRKDGWTRGIGPYRMVALSLQKIGAKYK